MDAIRRRVTKFRDHVLQNLSKSPQRQQVSPNVENESEKFRRNQRRQQLEGLFISTRAAKHFQREIIKGIESYISASSKQHEACRRLAEECTTYAMEGPNPRWPLSQAAYVLGKLYLQKEKEREILHHALRTQVLEPLRAMVMNERLEEARTLCERYDHMSQEVEAKAIEVSRRKAKSCEPSLDDLPEYRTNKVKDSETKLAELKSALATLGKEAAFAMVGVENQQQKLTLQRLTAMVEAERSYHGGALQILQHLEMQMVSFDKQHRGGAPSIRTSPDSSHAPSTPRSSSPGKGKLKPNAGLHESGMPARGAFLAQVMHSFEAQEPGELSLTLGDIVAVRQVSPNGWSEGECKGKCGWFPSSHVQRRDKVPISLMEPGFSLERPNGKHIK